MFCVIYGYWNGFKTIFFHNFGMFHWALGSLVTQNHKLEEKYAIIMLKSSEPIIHHQERYSFKKTNDCIRIVLKTPQKEEQ